MSMSKKINWKRVIEVLVRVMIIFGVFILFYGAYDCPKEPPMPLGSTMHEGSPVKRKV